jgi:VWFA-related protein
MKLRAAALFGLAVAAGPASAQQPTPFQSRVEVLPIDVTVVDRGGRPVTDLTARDFTVRVDGQPRRVVSAQWIAQVAAVDAADRGPAAAPIKDYVSNTGAGGASSLVILAVDEANTPFGRMRPMLPAISRFIDRRPAGDRIAIVSLGLGTTAWTDFTADRELVKRKLAQMPGQKLSMSAAFSHHVGLAAALGFWRREQDALRAVIQRECGGSARSGRASGSVDCMRDVEAEALKVAQEALHNTDVMLASLRDVIAELRKIDAPKTLILISDGLAYEQAGGAQPIVEIGELAAAARTSIYTLKLEEPQFDDDQAQSPLDLKRDQMERLNGLQALTLAASGALFTLTGTATGIFDRIESELSGYYLLGVEPTARDRDGKPHPIQISVSRSGLTTRSRRSMAADPKARPRSVEDRLNAALANPLPLSAIPLRGIAFSLGASDGSKLQLLIHADIGAEYTVPRVMSVGHLVLDAEGRSVDGQLSEIQFGPKAPGVPSSFEYARTTTVDRGDYIVKIAVADGDLLGSVEIPVHASLVDAPPVRLTELIVGGPLAPPNLLRPTIGSPIRFGTVHGYLEVYGAAAGAIGVTFEVAAGDDSMPLLRADVPPRLSGAERAIFSATLPVDQLPPGIYQLRAAVNRESAPLTTVRRAFEVAASPASSSATVFLPVAAADLARPFELEEALKAPVIALFRSRVQGDAARLFDEGVSFLENRRYLEAASAFERAVQPGDPNASLAYLGVSFAATGHDPEAIAVWRKAIGAGNNLPGNNVLHQWLIDALLRTKSYGEARTVATRARQQWPTDARFARPLALLHASSGSAREALTAIEEYLRAYPDDQNALFLAVNWLFNVRRAGQGLQGLPAVHDRDEALRLARIYAQQYTDDDRPRRALVALWINYLEQ